MKTDLIKTALFLIFTWSAATLSAQYEYCTILNPDNQKTVLQEIKSCYSYGIEISDDELINFLAGKSTPTYDPTLFPPIPEHTRNGGEVLFWWEDVPDYTNYQVRTLNLRTGSTTDELTEKPRFRFDKNGDIFIFLFATQHWNALGKKVKSAEYIIIDEKPIFKDDSVAYPCTCDHIFNAVI